MSGDTFTPVKVGQRILVIDPTTYRRMTPSGWERMTLLGMQGTVQKEEGEHRVEIRDVLVFGYVIDLANGQEAILKRHHFIPINDPPKKQEPEKEKCLIEPVSSV